MAMPHRVFRMGTLSCSEGKGHTLESCRARQFGTAGHSKTRDGGAEPDGCYSGPDRPPPDQNLILQHKAEQRLAPAHPLTILPVGGEVRLL